MNAHFTIGATVRVRNWHGPGHMRTPHYIRGLTGVVERVLGPFRNPEELAYGRSGNPPRPLYRVRFEQRAIWPDYSGPCSDTVDLEIYEHWLEPI